MSTLVPRLRVGLGEVLRAIGVLSADTEKELVEMESVVYGKTSNRQVLGIMVDFAKLLAFYIDDAPTTPLLDLSLQLAETPCSPLFKTTCSPDRIALELFGARPSLRLVR